MFAKYFTVSHCIILYYILISKTRTATGMHLRAREHSYGHLCVTEVAAPPTACPETTAVTSRAELAVIILDNLKRKFNFEALAEYAKLATPSKKTRDVFQALTDYSVFARPSPTTSCHHSATH